MNRGMHAQLRALKASPFETVDLVNLGLNNCKLTGRMVVAG